MFNVLARCNFFSVSKCLIKNHQNIIAAQWVCNCVAALHFKTMMMLIISLGEGGAPETTNACISAAAAMIFPFSVWGLGKCNFPLPSTASPPSGWCLALFGFQIKLEESVWSECGLLGQSAAFVMLVCVCLDRGKLAGSCGSQTCNFLRFQGG